MIIPAYCNNKRAYHLLQRCLESLRQQLWGDFSVVVVDDGSPPPFAAEQLKAWAPRRSVFLRHSQNKGRAVARNTGWQYVQADSILFLDADMYTLPDTLKTHFTFHRERGTQWIGQGHIIGQQDLSKTPTESVWTDASQAFFATGQVSIAREALIQTGGFDPEFSVYGWEDFELGLRLKQRGYRQAKLKSAITYHFEPLFCVEDWACDRQKEYDRAKAALILLKKHPDAQFLCQASVLDASVSHLLKKWIPLRSTLRQLEALQTLHPKLALAIYRGLLHQEYVSALNILRRG